MASLQSPHSRLIFDPMIYPTLQTWSKPVDSIFEVSILYALFTSTSLSKHPWGTELPEQPVTVLLLLYLAVTYFGTKPLGINVTSALPVLFLLPSSIKIFSGTDLLGQPVTTLIVLYLAIKYFAKHNDINLNITSILPILFLLPSFIQLPSAADVLGQPVTALLLLYLTITYLNAEKKKGGEESGSDDGSEEDTQPLAEGLFATIQSFVERQFPAIKLLSKPLGPYFKVAFYLALAWNSPLHAESSLNVQPWMYCILLLFGIFFGVLAPTTKFYGPLRFGYLQYTDDLTRTYTILLKWWVYTTYTPLFYPIIFAAYTAVLICITVRNAFEIQQSYNKRLQEITHQVNGAVSEATVAKGHSSDLTNVAHQYEVQMLTVLATARRDALRAKKVRVTDFFDTRARAWSAVDTVKNPIEKIIERTNNLVDATMAYDETEKPDDNVSKYLVDQANIALREAKAVDSKVDDARTAISLGRDAIEKDGIARTEANAEFVKSSTALTTLNAALAKVETGLLNISGHLEEAKRQAEKAVVTATEGEMDTADKAAEDAKKAAESATVEKTSLSSRMKEVRSALSDLLRRE